MEQRIYRPYKKRKYGKGWIIGILFVLPAVLFNIIFDWYPIAEGMIRSFYNWNGYSTPIFIGIDNFIEIFSDKVFWVSCGNMIFFLVLALILMFPTIIASVVLFRVKNKRLQYIYRVLFCIPMVIPGVVLTLMWQFMFNVQYGLFNNLLDLFHLETWKQTWLADHDLVKWCIVFMGFPFVSTNAALIYQGGLKSISDSVWEAAALDGIGPLRKFFSLEFPLIVGQFKLNLIGVISGAITGYGTQLILTGGGPGFSSMVPGLYMYNAAFSAQRYGFSSAVGLILFMLSLSITLLSMKFLKNREG